MARGQGRGLSALASLRSDGERWWRRLRAAGTQRLCPLCDSRLRRFLPHGDPVREQSVCPVCYSRERHRLAWSYIDRVALSGSAPRRVLHLAPERSIAGKLKSRPGIQYVCGDINPHDGIRFDIHQLPFADASFDFIYCSHVLNMVRDDLAALRELGRVLRPEGLALVQIPIAEHSHTLDAGSDWDAGARVAAFRDAHMWRRHGADVVERLRASGLEVSRLDWAASFGELEFERLGLIREDLLLCRHPETP